MKKIYAIIKYMRDNNWLKIKLEKLWSRYFYDIPQKNLITISFGRKARTRLGSIRKDCQKKPFSTEITITGYFRDENIPDFIIETTIAHEICHYAHGFSSPLPQLSKHPHQGSIVDKELIKRGLGDHLLAQKRWLKSEWPKIIKKDRPITKKRLIIKNKENSLIKIFFGTKSFNKF